MKAVLFFCLFCTSLYADAYKDSFWARFESQNFGVMRAHARLKHWTRPKVYDYMHHRFHNTHFAWLDVGISGMVDFSNMAPKLDFDYIGVDVSQTIVDDSAPYLSSHRGNDQLLVWDINEKEIDASLAPHSFDLLTMRHVLNHCPSYEQPLANASQLLKKGGTLIIVLQMALTDGPDIHDEMIINDAPMLLNTFNKERFFTELQKNFHVERFIRMDDHVKANDIIYARLKEEGQKEDEPKMEYVSSSWAGYFLRKLYHDYIM